MINHKQIVGAVFDFAGYLTTRIESITVGAKHDTAPMVKLLETWSEERGLNMDRPNISGWEKDDAVLVEQYPSLEHSYNKLMEAYEEFELVKKLVQDHDKE